MTDPTNNDSPWLYEHLHHWKTLVENPKDNFNTLTSFVRLHANNLFAHIPNWYSAFLQYPHEVFTIQNALMPEVRVNIFNDPSFCLEYLLALRRALFKPANDELFDGLFNLIDLTRMSDYVIQKLYNTICHTIHPRNQPQQETAIQPQPQSTSAEPLDIDAEVVCRQLGLG